MTDNFKPPGYKAPKTRIKITEYNSGEKIYEPQYCPWELWKEIVHFPIILLCALAGHVVYTRWISYKIPGTDVECNHKSREDAEKTINRELVKHLQEAQREYNNSIRSVKKEKYP